MSTVEALRHCELFACLEEDEMAQIAAIAREETFKAGDPICGESELADRLFILRKGRIGVHIRLRSGLEPDGDVTIEEMEPGRIFGWSSLVRQRRFTASAKALEPVSLLVIDSCDLETLFDQNAHLGFVVMKQLAEVIASRLQHTRDQLEEKATHD